MRKIWLNLIALTMLLAGSVFAQQGSTGQIAGFVRDQAGAVVAGVTVTAVLSGTGLTRTAQSDNNGYYVIPNLPAGTYEVSIQHEGFKKFVQTGVKVDAASKISIDASLQVGGVSDVITIEASADQIIKDTAAVGRLVESKQVTELQLNGRNFIRLAMLKAGVINTGSFNAFDFSTLSTGGLLINGSRTQQNNVLIDGVQTVRTRSAGASIGGQSIDSIAEVQILTSSYSAEYGRDSGGQLIYVTKSGTSEFHVTGWEFLRNSAFNANSWSRNASGQPTVQPFRYNQFGYTVGGPITIPGLFNRDRKKQLYFFFNQEWTRLRQESTSFAIVPTVEQRNGDFSKTFTSSGQLVVIRDPDTGQPFPGNIIPKSRFSPNGVALLSMYPLPNTQTAAGQNLFMTATNPVNQRNESVRIDYTQGKHHVMLGLYHYARKQLDPFRGSFPHGATFFDRPNRRSMLSLTSTISPTLINEASFGTAVDIVHINIRNLDLAARSKYGINYPYLFPGTKGVEDHIPTLTIQGFSEIDGGPYPAFSSGPIFHWSDNLTMIRGPHNFKFGIYIERSGENDLDQINVQPLPGDTNNQNGRFVFNNTGNPRTTGFALANVLLGDFNTYAEIGQKAYTPWRATAIEWFAQDSWKATPNLSIEYGVRWSYWPPWYSLFGNIAEFHPAFYDPAKAVRVDPRTGAIVPGSGDRFNGVVLPGNGFPEAAKGRVDAASDPQFQRLFHGLPEGFSETHKNVFAPRIGIAYALNEKTSIRAGFGIFHNRELLNDSTLLGGNAPIQFKEGTSNGKVDNPGGGTGATRPLFPILYTMQDPIFKHPTAYSWSFTVQRQLPSKTILEVAYIGKSTAFLPRERNINQLQPGTIQRNPGVNPDSLRPFQGFATIRLSENAAHSTYHGMQISADRRFSNGLSFGMAYTLSKSIDNASDKRNILPNNFDDKHFRGPSDFDIRHYLTANYVYELPFGPGKRWLNAGGAVGKIIGGWQVSGVTFLRSGTPFSIIVGSDIAGVGAGSGNQFAQLVGDPSVIGGRSYTFVTDSATRRYVSGGFFNPDAFANPAAGTYGNLGRNTFRNPRSQSWDIALFKNTRISEKFTTQFRAEFFNFPNHPNPGGSASNTVGNSNFGRLGNKSSERQLQFGLKLMF